MHFMGHIKQLCYFTTNAVYSFAELAYRSGFSYLSGLGHLYQFMGVIDAVALDVLESHDLGSPMPKAAV